MKETTQGMTIEKLENYKGLVAEMHSLSESIDSLYDTYRSPQFCRNGGSHSNNVWSPVEDAVNRIDRKSTRLNSSHVSESRMPSSA